MTPQERTVWFIVVWVSVLLVYDVVVGVVYGLPATVSDVIRSWSHQHAEVRVVGTLFFVWLVWHLFYKH